MTIDHAKSQGATAPAASRPHPRASRWRGRQRLLAHLALIAVALVLLYPLLWMLSSSLKPAERIFTDLNLWPGEFEWGNYVRGWNAAPGHSFTRFFANSLIVSGLSVIGNLISCSLAAYAFARVRFAFRKVLFGVMLASIMLPLHVVVVQQYILFNQLGWIDTFLPLLAPRFLAVDSFFIFLMVQFIRSLPVELEQAARVDGCGHWQIFRHIVLPLSKPALVTTAIFTFMWTYDDFFSQNIFLSSIKNYTVPLALRLFRDAEGASSWGPAFAMSTLSLVPVVVFFVGFQKLLVEGVATSGLKG